jgi:hypothetical protein
MDLIERASALEIVRRISGDYAAAFAEIGRLPAVDAVQVIRCRDCEHWEKQDFRGARHTGEPMVQGGECRLLVFMALENDFCSLGKRREEPDAQ